MNDREIPIGGTGAGRFWDQSRHVESCCNQGNRCFLASYLVQNYYEVVTEFIIRGSMVQFVPQTSRAHSSRKLLLCAKWAASLACLAPLALPATWRGAR